MIIIFAKRWFDKINGNTYHSVSIYNDKNFIARVPYAYGYSDAYLSTAYVVLKEKNLISPELKYSDWLQDGNYIDFVADVSRKKDL